jgi:hypothetical protein
VTVTESAIDVLGKPGRLGAEAMRRIIEESAFLQGKKR